MKTLSFENTEIAFQSKSTKQLNKSIGFLNWLATIL